MNIASTKQRLQDTRASNVVEFALLALILFGTVLGFIDVCRFMYVYTTVANAARAGERYAIVHGIDRTGVGINGPSSSSDYSQVTAVVNNYFHLINFRTGTDIASPCPAAQGCMQVDYLDGPNTVGSRVRVAVQYPYNPLTIFLSNGGGGWFTISSASEGVIAF